MKKTGRRPALPVAAVRLAEILPPARLHPVVRAWAQAAPVRAPWAVAFSGGADSLALLLLLWAHWPERRAGLRVLHFNHRLRGAASTRDVAFCRRVCAALGLRFHSAEWLASDRQQAGEAGARAARQEFFTAQMRRARSTALWLGHQQDDVAETMLMRLARGSGTAGLAAPRPVQPMPAGRVHLRPLLGLKKAEICAALRAAGLRWREDASNAGSAFFRNRVRHEVLPPWCEVSGRDSLAGAARSRELLEDDDDALEAWLAALAPLAADGSLNLRRLAGKPRALWRRALHRWLGQFPGGGRNLSRQAFEALLRDAMRGRITRHSLGATGFGVISKTRLRLAAAPPRQNNSAGFQRAAN
jgi:tRNA(Ile)-lysidine synthase